MNAKTIPLKDVQAALMCAIIRQRSNKPDGQRHGRVAAYTLAPFWLPSCKDRLRRRRSRTAMPKVLEHHFEPMSAGALDMVLERTRRERGLQEVRRTWGVGYRALQAEFGGCVVMR